jgi:hypothetical protein
MIVSLNRLGFANQLGSDQDAGWNGGQHAMAQAYSLDRRQRVVVAVATSGGNVARIVEQHASRSSQKRYGPH